MQIQHFGGRKMGLTCLAVLFPFRGKSQLAYGEKEKE